MRNNLQGCPRHAPLMKGLVETRAKADAECIRLPQLIHNLTAQLHKAQVERGSYDLFITKLNSRIQPRQIDPIHAWQGRYGKRGAFKQAMLNLRMVGNKNHSACDNWLPFSKFAPYGITH